MADLHRSLLYQTHDAFVGICGIITSSRGHDISRVTIIFRGIDCYSQIPFKPKARKADPLASQPGRA